jgi:hypothetical protein
MDNSTGCSIATVKLQWRCLKVEDGVLHFDPAAAKNGEGGDLVTDKEYNFHLKLNGRSEIK